MLIFSPKRLLDTLRIPYAGIILNNLMAWSGKCERTCKYWLSQERIPKKSDFEHILARCEQIASQQGLSFVRPKDSSDFIRQLKNPDWRMFAIMQLQEENEFRLTFTMMLRYAHGDGLNPHAISSYLPPERRIAARESMGVSLCELQKLLDDFLEIAGCLNFIAAAEAEYLASVGSEYSLLMKLMPVRHGERQVVTPTEKFFRNFFNFLKDCGHYLNDFEIAEELEDWLEYECRENAERVMNRVKNDNHQLSWGQFRKWCNKLLPFGGADTDESRTTALQHAENFYGGALILQACFMDYAERFPEPLDQLLRQFECLYSALFSKYAVEMKKLGRAD